MYGNYHKTHKGGVKLKRQELLDAIAKVKPALEDGKLIEFKGLLLFDGEKLVCYGDEISVSVPLKTDFVTAVKAQEFIKLISKTTEAELTIKIIDKQLVVTSGLMKAGFASVDYEPESVPDLGLSQVGRWFSLPDDFTEVLKFCIFSAASNDGYGVLCNLKVASDNILSSDNYRITERLLSKKLAGLKSGFLLIPRKIATFLSGFKLKNYAITDACAHYKDETGVVFTHRLILEEYPEDIVDHLQIKGQKLELPKNLIGALNRALAISTKEEEAKATIIVEKKTIKIKAEGTGTWFEEPVTSDYKGENLQFDAAPEHLIQILSRSTTTTIGEDALLFTGEGFRHSVCLFGEEE